MTSATGSPRTWGSGERLRVLLWHVHGSWTTSFVHGRHTYLLPTLPERGPWGLGRCGRPWPDSAREVLADDLAGTDVDVVVLQRQEELDLVERWLGRRPGADLPAVYVEHNTPRGQVPETRHPLGGRGDIPLVHVTYYNELLWDSGDAPTTVIPHGILDPGYRYTGEYERAAVTINEPVRRWRYTGTDLLPTLAGAVPIDVYGMSLDELNAQLGVAPPRVRAIGDLGQEALYTELAGHRLYLHTARWTSLGLSLIEAMQLGMPVVAVASTEAARAVPSDAGVVSANVEELADAARELVADPELARGMGKSARESAVVGYGVETFLRNWDVLLDRVVRSPTGGVRR